MAEGERVRLLAQTIPHPTAIKLPRGWGTRWPIPPVREGAYGWGTRFWGGICLVSYRLGRSGAGAEAVEAVAAADTAEGVETDGAEQAVEDGAASAPDVIVVSAVRARNSRVCSARHIPRLWYGEG
jgi:hypothetical protein